MAYYDETEHASFCPQCDHEQEGPMGALGRVLHYRCRMCGWQWSVDPAVEERPPVPEIEDGYATPEMLQALVDAARTLLWNMPAPRSRVRMEEWQALREILERIENAGGVQR